MFKSVSPKIKARLPLLLILSTLVITVPFVYTHKVHAQGPPSIPQIFYGQVTISGSPAVSGIPVATKVGGTQLGSTSTDAQGKYGINPVFVVSPTASNVTIDFYVNGVKADQSVSYNPGNRTELNLTVSGSNTPPAATTTSVQSSILGASDTFSLSNGVLSSAKELASTDGRVKLSLPAGSAINMQGSTQLGAATESNPPASTDGSTMVLAYSFIPSGATFSPAATMTLKYELASLPAGATEAGLYIAYWNGTAWEKLTSTVNTATKQVSAPVSHFTIFSLRYLTPTATTPTTPTTPITPATPTTPVSTGVISTSVLNTSGSFSISGGTVPSATSLSSSSGKMGISLAANTAVSLPNSSQQITVIQLAEAPAPPANSRVIEAYSFSPDNTTFSPAASVTVKYDSASLPPDVLETGLYLALLENSNWTEVPSSVDPVAKTVTAKVSHFSTYALLGRVTAAPVTPVNPTAPETPAIPATTPATTPAAAGTDAASDMSMPILAIIIAGGLLIIVLAVILVMRQRSSGY